MKKNKSQYRGILENTMRKKMAVLLMVPISLLGIIFLFGINYFSYFTRVTEEQNSLDVAQIFLEQLFETSESVAETVENHGTTIYLIKYNEYNDITDFYSHKIEFDTFLSSMHQYCYDLDGIYAISKYDVLYKSNFRTAQKYTYTESCWYQEIEEEKTTVWFPSHRGSYVAEDEGIYMISVGVPALDRTTGEVNGIIYIEIQLDVVMEMIESSLCDSKAITVITDEDYNVFEMEDSPITQEEFDNIVNNNAFYNLIRYKVIDCELDMTGWHLVKIIPNTELWGESVVICCILVLVLVLSIFASRNYIEKLTQQLFEPLKHIRLVMKQVGNENLKVRVQNSSEDEIGELSRDLDKMIFKIDTLLQSVRDNEEHINKLKMSALQAQINPHFLYNVLDNINWLAREKNFTSIIDINYALTTFYRSSLSKGKDIVPIYVECEHINSYITIQKYRYMDKANYHVDIPKNLHNYVITKLILQPIVENAIYHGIKALPESGDIYIRGIEEEENIVFIIEDTGVGMDEITLENLNSDNGEIKIQSSSYGISNVKERLALFFHNSAKIEYQSEKGKGTCVKVVLPKMTEEEYKHKEWY